MSLKDDLKALNLSDEQVDSVEVLLRKQISGEYIPKSRFDEVNTKAKDLAKELVRAETEKEALEKTAKEAQEQLRPLQEQFESSKAEWESKYKELEDSYNQREADRVLLTEFEAKQNAIKSFLGDTAYDPDLVSGFIDFDSLAYDGSSVSGISEAIETIKKDKPFLFKSDSMDSTAPHSGHADSSPKGGDFGKALADKASAMDALTKAAEQKYFG